MMDYVAVNYNLKVMELYLNGENIYLIGHRIKAIASGYEFDFFAYMSEDEELGRTVVKVIDSGTGVEMNVFNLGFILGEELKKERNVYPLILSKIGKVVTDFLDKLTIEFKLEELKNELEVKKELNEKNNRKYTVRDMTSEELESLTE